MKKRLGLIHTGPYTHLDHLAPLAFILEKPLIVTSLEDKEKASLFYPMIKAQYIPLEVLTLDYLASSFDVLVTCGKFWALELKPLFASFYHKELTCIFAPHGYSDKEKILNHPVPQDIHLIYGPSMKKECLYSRFVEMGNLRHWFYRKHQAHFDALLASHLSFSDKLVVLYAPTWSSKASSSSFFSHIDTIAETLSKEVQLVLKPHPLLEENDPARYFYFIQKYQKDLSLLLDVPLIYPLLEKTDIYLGDTSSIGYDFLYYDRPLFFLETSSHSSLQRCGLPFKGDIFKNQKELSTQRKDLYKEVFGSREGDVSYPDKVKKELLALLL